MSTSSSSSSYDHLFKIVLIGDAGVGKSSLLLRFTDDRFEDGHLSTIGVDLRVKFVDIDKPTPKRIKVTVWDTAGQERFRTLTASYFHKVQGLILVYDVTRRDTFDNLEMWNQEIDVNTDGSPVVRILVGNKVDEAAGGRQVSKREGEQWAQQHSMLFVESSAKTRTGVSQVFMECIHQILDNQLLVNKNLPAGVTLSPPPPPEQEPNNNNLACC